MTIDDLAARIPEVAAYRALMDGARDGAYFNSPLAIEALADAALAALAAEVERLEALPELADKSIYVRREREQRWRAEEAESELAALKARTCGTCRYRKICEQQVYWNARGTRDEDKDVDCCSLWAARPDSSK